MLTRDQVERSLPANLKSSATQALTDQINTIISDPVVAEDVRNNFVSYTSVMRDGKFKIADYLNAVVYVTHKLMGYGNAEAYERTFPQRYAALLAGGKSSKDISSYVAAYHKNKLVNLIMEQTLIPVHILNAEIYQRAINVQADLMLNANSEKVRSDAANSILTHLAKPKDVAPAVQIDINQNGGMKELEDMLLRIAAQQREAIESGVPTALIAATPLVDKPAVEVLP